MYILLLCGLTKRFFNFISDISPCKGGTAQITVEKVGM